MDLVALVEMNKIKETNSKYPLKGTLEQPDDIKTIQQDDYPDQ